MKQERGLASNRVYLSIFIGGLLLGSIIGYAYKTYEVNRQLASRDIFPERTEVEKLPGKKAEIISGYVLIPEMNIKLFVGQALSDLTYSIEKIQTEHRNPYRMEYSMIAGFSTESLENASSGCTPEYGAIGSIERSGEEPAHTQEVNIKRIGDYYYTWSHPQATCSDEPEAAPQGGQAKLLEEAFQTAEAIN